MNQLFGLQHRRDRFLIERLKSLLGSITCYFSCAKIVICFLSSKFFRQKNTKSSKFIISISAKFSDS